MTDMHVHADVERLSAYADGDLDPAASARIAHAVETCEECRIRLGRVRSLVAAAGGLPREIAVPPDSWSELRERIARDRSARAGFAWRRYGMVAAAAVVLAVAGTALLRSEFGVTPPLPAAAPISGVPVVLAVDGNYTSTLLDLRSILDAQRHQLSPHTVRVVEHSLALIDSAIAEAREALAADPANQVLTGILAAQYERKVDLLQRATKLSPAS